MAVASINRWKPGTDLPYVTSVGEGRMLAILLPATWIKAGRSGEPLLLPPAIRGLDRVRALFVRQEGLTPGFIASLREGMGLTQQEFGKDLGVSKMTVSRWECGQMRPSASARTAIYRLQAKARKSGVVVDGERRTSRIAHSIHRTRHLK